MEQFEQGEPAESTVDIKAYAYLIWASAWWILLAGALAAAAAYLVSIRSTPIFQASTHILVSAPSAINGMDPSSLVTTQTMTDTYSQMLLDRPVLQGVIDQLKLPAPTDDFKKFKESIKVSIVPNTQLLVVTVEDPSPQRAADVANAIATVFAARINELQSQRYGASREGLAKQVADMEQQVATITSQIAAIEERVAAAGTQTAATATPISAAASTGTARAQQASSIPNAADSAALEQLQARLTQYRTIYSNLVTSYEQVRLSEDQTSTNVVISEPAAVPSLPVRPRTWLNTVLAGVIGMLLAAGVVLAVDSLDDTVRNPEEIRKKFNLPILGMIAWHEAPEDNPITLAQPRSPTAEAFRSMRTNITYAAVDRPLRRLMITSPTPEDGKTTVACNLAAALAQGEKHVVLIDADMRRPMVHRKFGLKNRLGLSESFVNPLGNLANVLNASGLNKLAVLTSGGLPPNPSELLASKMTGQILAKLDETFDIIVIDTPPVLTVTDAAALAPVMDGVVLVAKPGTTKVAALHEALRQLRAVNARVLGVVLNEVNARSRKYGYYYNRYYSKY